eukprot:4092113-Prorocentrum_lima.AAC.1
MACSSLIRVPSVLIFETPKVFRGRLQSVDIEQDRDRVKAVFRDDTLIDKWEQGRTHLLRLID